MNISQSGPIVEWLASLQGTKNIVDVGNRFGEDMKIDSRPILCPVDFFVTVRRVAAVPAADRPLSIGLAEPT